MLKDFVFINNDKDFERARKGKKKQAVLGKAFNDAKSIKMVKDSGFSVWIAIEKSRKISVGSLTSFAGRPEKEKGTIYAVTGKRFEKILLSFGSSLEFIDGFILPAPKFGGVLWNKSIERRIHKSGEIYDIFDEDVAESHIRSLYYEVAEDCFVDRYIRPIYEIAKNLDISVCFNMGSGEIQYDFMQGINPIRLICEGISVAFDGVSAEVDALRCLMSQKEVKKLLLIKPVRGARMKYVYTNTRSRVRLENPALCASFEGTYFCDRLKALRRDFTAVDEYTLENHANLEAGKIKLFSQYYEQVIVSDNCRFTEKGVTLIEDAIKSGVSVNSKELLNELAIDVMEEI